ncbi:MAG: nucleotidyltransferase family protein [Nitrososphaerota archaeon]|nr:nucleotidyltransferase family protein [Nitrososphaerota archaeon]MDG6972746.1 nucleotidyltransferase family protein [Nitrososphaerota archaeon]MDG6974025.1 nucleotidyltransferase family protein [Nitrososphaerota archaeon]MDG6987567.1 nucleotidyltransferase family protein [Nitrososphaerota archaeon]MDG7026741.1 nucleotidyltransferase family protein [Nitrososphaerota archaeon]
MDGYDLSYPGENSLVEKGTTLFNDLHIQVEVENGACVHLWYKEHFGHDIVIYHSSKDAISTWPITAT